MTKKRSGIETARSPKEPLGPDLGSQEEKKLRPSVAKRRNRQVSITFSNANIPERLRTLALEWGLYAPDGKSPGVSAVLEYLLLPQLEAAEDGKISSPRS